ncbi:hypothetical protein J6590_048958 [Homalodisca vitripennis]|nr:hypothetical protein J6590_048958 [Homalodisca vitripennis]
MVRGINQTSICHVVNAALLFSKEVFIQESISSYPFQHVPTDKTIEQANLQRVPVAITSSVQVCWAACRKLHAIGVLRCSYTHHKCKYAGWQNSAEISLVRAGTTWPGPGGSQFCRPIIPRKPAAGAVPHVIVVYRRRLQSPR